MGISMSVCITCEITCSTNVHVKNEMPLSVRGNERSGLLPTLSILPETSSDYVILNNKRKN